MEIRTLRYFLEIAREENMTRAAEALHVSQPALSKQMRQLEEELGKKLFTRRSFSIELTEEGRILRKRAADLISMADKITGEFLEMNDVTGGTVSLGLAESCHIRELAGGIRTFKEKYPNFHYHITSGDTEQVTERLNKGLLDFAVIVETPDTSRYDYIEFPQPDVWGVIMKRKDPLAEKEAITIEDLAGQPVFISRQSWEKDMPRWCGHLRDEMRLEGTFRLSYNASHFVAEGLGYLITLKGLIHADGELAFRPLSPSLETKLYLIWRKYQAFTPIADRFLSHIKEYFAGKVRKDTGMVQ